MMLLLLLYLEMKKRERIINVEERNEGEERWR